jgi:uncharacterized protein
MKKTPFIYLFTSPKSKYIYDFNTNAIIRIAEDVYQDLREYLRSGELTFRSELSEKGINLLVENGFLQAKRWSNIIHPATMLLEQHLNGSVEYLVLQVTQQCNLRCKYCPYSGTYYNREHNDKCMDIEIAKKAIDFYIKHSYDIKTLNIAFYGGEPLIKYELIKKLVEYAKTMSDGKEVLFHMTTNATLMNGEVIEFLVKNDFRLAISIDGPKDLHDKNRENINGKGSFETVIRNVELIKKNYPEYIKNVMLNCVLDPSNDLGCINDFFANYESVKDFMTMFSDIAREGMKDEKYILLDDYTNTYDYEVFKLFLYKVGLISEKNISHIVKSYYEYIKTLLYDRNISDYIGEDGHPGGPCIPGSHKLFVDINGKFYPCEKLNECSDELVIGDINRGFFMDKIEKILNVGKLTKEDCVNCWCGKFCYQCVLFVEDGNGISKEMRKSRCKSVMNEIDKLIKDYCLVKEMEEQSGDIYFL